MLSNIKSILSSTCSPLLSQPSLIAMSTLPSLLLFPSSPLYLLFVTRSRTRFGGHVEVFAVLLASRPSRACLSLCPAVCGFCHTHLRRRLSRQFQRNCISPGSAGTHALSNKAPISALLLHPYSIPFHPNSISYPLPERERERGERERGERLTSLSSCASAAYKFNQL